MHAARTRFAVPSRAVSSRAKSRNRDTNSKAPSCNKPPSDEAQATVDSARLSDSTLQNVRAPALRPPWGSGGRADEARTTAWEVSLARREAQWVSNVAELLHCADEFVQTEEQKDSAAASVFVPPLEAAADGRLKKFEEVLERRLESLRFVTEQQAKLTQSFDKQRKALVEEHGSVAAALGRLNEDGAETHAARLAAIEAQIADTEQMAVQEARIRQAEFEAQQAKIEESKQTLLELKESCDKQSRMLSEAQHKMATGEHDAQQLEGEMVALEERRHEVRVREISLRCMEVGWEKAVAQCRAHGAVSREDLVATATGRIANELIKSEGYMSQLRELVNSVLRNSSRRAPGFSGESHVQCPPSSGSPPGNLLVGLQSSSHPNGGNNEEWNSDHEGVSAASTADLDDGEFLGSPTCPSAHSGGARSEGRVEPEGSFTALCAGTASVSPNQHAAASSLATKTSEAETPIFSPPPRPLSAPPDMEPRCSRQGQRRIVKPGGYGEVAVASTEGPPSLSTTASTPIISPRSLLVRLPGPGRLPVAIADRSMAGGRGQGDAQVPFPVLARRVSARPDAHAEGSAGSVVFGEPIRLGMQAISSMPRAGLGSLASQHVPLTGSSTGGAAACSNWTTTRMPSAVVPAQTVQVLGHC